MISRAAEAMLSPVPPAARAELAPLYLSLTLNFCDAEEEDSATVWFNHAI